MQQSGRKRSGSGEGAAPGFPPSALEGWAGIEESLAGRPLAVFLDYDGTLAPIVDRPDAAELGEGMRGALRGLAAAWPTTIVSGRGRADVAARVGLEAVGYAGSHGFEIAGPGAAGARLEVGAELVPSIRAAAGELRGRTAGIPGAVVEEKRLSVAVHYRLVDATRVGEVEAAVAEALAARPELRRAAGKKVFELRPALEWDKGRAILWLLGRPPLDGAGVTPVYVGDDATDEDAFRALRGRGLTVVVADAPRPTAARHSLRDTGEVRELLARLARLGAPGS